MQPVRVGEVDVHGPDVAETSHISEQGFNTLDVGHARIAEASGGSPRVNQQFCGTGLARTVFITCKCFWSVESQEENKAQYDISK